MNIAVVGGAGHVGLPLAAMLASVGHHVRAIDTDTERIRSIQDGRSPFYETGLDNILAQGLAEATLTAHTDLTAAQECDVVFVVVGTDLSDDLSRVLISIWNICLFITAIAAIARPRLRSS